MCERVNRGGAGGASVHKMKFEESRLGPDSERFNSNDSFLMSLIFIAKSHFFSIISL